MADSTIEAFFQAARRDAALQEQVATALSQTDSVAALLAVARSAGFTISEDEMSAALGGALSDRSLESVAGGGMSAPQEWFAEVRKTNKIQFDGQ